MRPPLTPPAIGEWRFSDGYVARGRHWEPAGRPRGVRIYLHGIQSHSAWYQWSASILAQNDWAVVAPDRRGSGMNTAARGDTPDAQRWLTDLHDLCDWIDARYQRPAIELVGLSWGGKLAAAAAIRWPERFSRVLLITPGIFPRVDVPLRRKVAIALNLGAGGRGAFEIPLNDANLFTDNPAGRLFIENDPLRLTHATARFLAWSARLDGRTQRAAAGAIRSPLTLLLAGRDAIIRNAPLRAWAARVSAGPMDVIEFASEAHTIELAADASAFERQIRTWADEKAVIRNSERPNI